MGDSHSPDAIKRHMKLYLAVFGGLLLGTILTVAMYYVYFEKVSTTVTIALIIATAKASLVALFFMHLSGEKKTIYYTLATTVFFFAGLMALTLFSFGDIPTLTE
jgi:cytochrome c oxidase subunit IV